MGLIKASVDRLFALGAVCQQQAEALSIGRAGLQNGPSFQETTSAVDGVLAMASRAENLMSVRLHTTGHTVVGAAVRLANCEEISRRRISAVGTMPTVI